MFTIQPKYNVALARTLVQYILHYLYRLKAAKVTDKRVRVMNEIISGMRLIKMYAWEWAFHEHVKTIRKLAMNFVVLSIDLFC